MKVLVLSLATTLTVGMTSVSTFAIDKNISNSLSSVSIPSVSGYNIEDSGLNSKVIATLKEKAAELQNSGVYADATKSTYIKFNGSPVQEVAYDVSHMDFLQEFMLLLAIARLQKQICFM